MGMSMQEMTRIIDGLEKLGWSNDQILAFLYYIASGNEAKLAKYMPAEKKEN